MSDQDKRFAPVAARRLALACLSGALLSVSLSAAGGDVIKPPVDQAASLFGAFHIMCNLKPPNFESLTAYAAALRLLPLEEATEVEPDGATLTRKAWIGSLTTGPFALRVEKMSGAKGVLTSCAIEGQVPDTELFRAMVVTRMQLRGTPEHELRDGTNIYFWENYGDTGMNVAVRDMDRPSGRFAQIKLLQMVPARPN